MLGLAPKFLIHRSGKEKGTENLHVGHAKEVPRCHAAAAEDHTQGTFDVAVVTVQVLLTDKPWAGHCQGALFAAVAAVSCLTT